MLHMTEAASATSVALMGAVIAATRGRRRNDPNQRAQAEALFILDYLGDDALTGQSAGHEACLPVNAHDSIAPVRQVTDSGLELLGVRQWESSIVVTSEGDHERERITGGVAAYPHTVAAR